MKEEAKQIGKWALYLLMETEYWDPKSLARITVESLEETEDRMGDWLEDNRRFYPPSGAEEVAREILTERVKDSPTVLDEDTAHELAMMRMDEEFTLENLQEVLDKIQVENEKRKAEYLQEMEEWRRLMEEDYDDVPASAMDRIPVDEQGEPLFEQAPSAEVATDALEEYFGEKDAAAWASYKVKALEDEIKKKRKALEKPSIERGVTPSQFRASQEQARQELAALEDALARWKAVAAEQEMRKNEQANRRQVEDREARVEENDAGQGTGDERLEDLQKKPRAKQEQLNSGIDPELFAVGVELSFGYIERGAYKFADYARTMIKEFGDVVRPYLKMFYNAVRDMPEAEEYVKEMDPYEVVCRFSTQQPKQKV